MSSPELCTTLLAVRDSGCEELEVWGGFCKLLETPRNSARVSSVVIQGARVFGAKMHASAGTGALSPEVGPTWVRIGPILLQVFLFLPEPNKF
jgi:hypothetical protein